MNKRELFSKIIKYSFLGRVTEIKKTRSIILDNSRLTQSLSNFYATWKSKLTNYLKASLVATLMKNIKEELCLSPVKTIGIFLIVVTVVNAVLSLILGKQISPWGLSMRGVLLLIGISGLSCKADWPAVKDSSIIFRAIPKTNSCRTFQS